MSLPVLGPRPSDAQLTIPIARDPELSPLVTLVRCPACGAPLELGELDAGPSVPDLGPDGRLNCPGCGREYPVRAGTVRMVARDPGDSNADVRRRTAESFAYEWERFGGLREEWRKNFRDYMRPHGPEFFDGLTVLDVGTGSGRHSHQADACGARVVAVDLGASIDVARGNLPPRVLTVQADADALPFAEGSFDFVMSIGVLHHLPDPGRTLRSIARYARPGGHVHVYLYWVPPRRWHQRVLALVTRARRVTTRVPHRLLHALCYPLAAALFAVFVIPYKVMRRIPALEGLADALPLKTYADYPFAVCVNDQFDRFSAPLERRYTREEVEELMRSAGLEAVQVLPNHGWVADGVRPPDGR